MHQLSMYMHCVTYYIFLSSDGNLQSPVGQSDKFTSAVNLNSTVGEYSLVNVHWIQRADGFDVQVNSLGKANLLGINVEFNVNFRILSG